MTEAGARAALVTGASVGIGRAISIALGGLGWRVALVARRDQALGETAELVSRAGGEPFVHTLDVCDIHSVDACWQACQEAMGPIDVLVNNAGITRPGAIHEMSDEDHALILATNLLGPILVTKRFVAARLEVGGGGDVVFISSDAVQHPRPSLLTYGASKAGLDGVARTLALEVEGTGIRSTIVRVGPTLTAAGDEWDPAIFETLIPRWQHFGLQRHWATMAPDDVARAVVAAVTMPASAHVPEIEVQPVAPRT